MNGVTRLFVTSADFAYNREGSPSEVTQVRTKVLRGTGPFGEGTQAAGLLIASLRGLSHGLLSHKGCAGRNANVISCQGIFLGCSQKNGEKTLSCPFYVVSFRGQIMLEPRPH